MNVAYTRAVSPTLAECELTHLERVPIDVARAAAEHAAYEAALRQQDVAVRRLLPQPEMPDAVFVEDTAVVLDDVAIITRPGSAARRREVFSVAEMLLAHRRLAWLQAPATLDGGDVLVDGRRVYVGLSTRTNTDGVTQLAAILHPLEYQVIPVRFRGCLHLKTAVTPIADGLLLCNPDWVQPSVFAGASLVTVDPAEPHAGNALAINRVLLHPAHFPRTRARLESHGLTVVPIDLRELAKAEAGVTCCSLVVPIGRC